ncbi:hypothetical protein MKW98_026650 [Papaver atlanticum]|uniref:Uncharacterized protein n=1 Tax=Papaver atlanticum TaxID=357466 RepID=A0AAD4X5K1_9MAGN|nr:hypothetical protein MKW98_026650 [Papaver atlanticum]
MFNRLNAIYETKINSNAACKAILPTYDPFFAVSIDTTGGIRDTRVRQNTAEMYSMLILLKNFDTWKTILS